MRIVLTPDDLADLQDGASITTLADDHQEVSLGPEGSLTEGWLDPADLTDLAAGGDDNVVIAPTTRRIEQRCRAGKELTMAQMSIGEAEALVRERLGEGYSVVKLSQYWLVWQTDARADTLTQSTSLEKAIRDQAARPKLPPRPQQPAAELLRVRPVVTTEGVLYQPWTDGYAVGFKATHPDGRVEFVYLNPSGESDDGQPTVLLYRGTAGTAEQDAPLTHVEIFPVEAEGDSRD